MHLVLLYIVQHTPVVCGDEILQFMLLVPIGWIRVLAGFFYDFPQFDCPCFSPVGQALGISVSEGIGLSCKRLICYI